MDKLDLKAEEKCGYFISGKMKIIEKDFDCDYKELSEFIKKNQYYMKNWD